MTRPDISPSRPVFYRQVRQAVPFLRRYARALTGSRVSGDKYAVSALETILSDTPPLDGMHGRVALFRVFHLLWTSKGQPVDKQLQVDSPEGRALHHLAPLTSNTREVLLLRTVEDMSIEEIAIVIGAASEEVNRLLDIAYREMANRFTGRILIIEDEPFIATDLQYIVTEMGHVVSGVAATRTEAVDLADREDFDLILSDIKLADDSRGSDAVAEIFANQIERPVVFITAYPEELLTGEGWEPAFLIAKPYEDKQVRTAVSQALFFAPQRPDTQNYVGT